MDIDRIEEIVRTLTTPSRRAVGRASLGVAVGSLFAPFAALTRIEAKHKHKHKRKHKKKKHPEPSPCPTGLQPCGDDCIDTRTDNANCGGCGRTCASGQVCDQGECSGGACDAQVSTVDELHDALETANTQNPFVICLAAGTYELPPDFFSTVPLPQPCDLDLPFQVSLLGAGAAQTILQGSGSDKVLQNLFEAHLARLTITGGFGSSGGGIANTGNLELTDCVVSGNTSNAGGGIFNNGNLVLDGCTITDNTAHTDINNGEGGGVWNHDTLTRINTTISGNTSDDGIDCLNVDEGTGC